MDKNSNETHINNNKKFSNRPLFLIFLTILVNLIGFGIIIPLLPFYAESMGASPFVIGLLFASFSICQLFGAPILGNFSDRYGRRPGLIISLLGTFVSFIILALSNNITMLFISRIIDGLSGGNIAIARAYIADITTEENRARGFGLIGAAFGLGYIFGPAIGGAFSHISYSAPAWIAAGLAFIATILTWFLLPETNHQASAGRKIQWSSVKNLLSRPIISNLLGIDFLYWATFAVYQTTFALFVAHRFNFNASETGYLLAFLSIIGVIMQLAIVGIVVKKFGERKVLASGLALVSLGLAGASLTTNLILLMITLIPASTGYALAAPTLISLISQTVTQEEQGSLQGLSGSLESFGRVVGPIWGNGFLEKFGESSPYFSASFAMIVLSFWIIFLKQKK